MNLLVWLIVLLWLLFGISVKCVKNVVCVYFVELLLVSWVLECFSFGIECDFGVGLIGGWYCWSFWFGVFGNGSEFVIGFVFRLERLYSLTNDLRFETCLLRTISFGISSAVGLWSPQKSSLVWLSCGWLIDTKWNPVFLFQNCGMGTLLLFSFS